MKIAPLDIEMDDEYNEELIKVNSVIHNFINGYIVAELESYFMPDTKSVAVINKVVNKCKKTVRIM